LPPARFSGFAFAADELLNAAVDLVTGHLNGGMLGKISGSGVKDPANAAVELEFGVAKKKQLAKLRST
jgi:hypothetical protein